MSFQEMAFLQMGIIYLCVACAGNVYTLFCQWMNMLIFIKKTVECRLQKVQW